MYVNGDSWSFANRPDHTNDTIWPGVVSKELNLFCVNESVGCGSNSRIVDKLTNFYLSGQRPKLILLGLTHHHRYHLPAANMGSWVMGPGMAIHEHTGEPNDAIRNWVYRYSYDELDSVYRYYKEIWELTELCKKFGCQYLIVQMWADDLAKLDLMSNNLNIELFVNSKLNPNQKHYAEQYIRAFKFLKSQSSGWNYIEKPVSSMLQYNDYNEDGHPSVSGHKKIAEYILQCLKT